VECAGPRCDRRASTYASHRQADHCRFPERSFDPAGQYHDSRTASCRGARRAASAAGGGECADAGAASGSGTERVEKAGRSQDKGGSTGSAFAGSRHTGRGSRRDRRLIFQTPPPKASLDPCHYI
jgi:hypothetical protein